MLEFKDFYDDFPLGVLAADASGAANYANCACSEITGLSAQQLLGYGWLTAVHCADRARVVAQWRRVCEFPRSLDIEFRVIKPDGSCRFVRISGGSSVAYGTPGIHLAVINDITDHVVAQQRLRRNNELLGAMLENIPCGISVFDADGSLVLDNQKIAFRSLPNDVPDSAITDFGTISVEYANHPLSCPDAQGPVPLDSGMAAAPQLREEVQPDGRVLEVRNARMPAGGTVVTHTDITHHKQIVENLQQAKAAAEQAAAAKTAFLATMSHEIRTPMNGVIGMTNILLETRLTSDQRELVEVIRQSGESLLVVINDILDYSKIESGQMELEWVPLRLEEVVGDSLRLLAPKADEKGLSLGVDIDPAVPPLILGDSTRLNQVLVNLVSNAVKFTEAGEVRVGVINGSSNSPHESGDEMGDLCNITVCVQDSGIGIPEEKLLTIFDPFVQADSSTGRRFGGTGLGLAIARRLVEAMGGEISVQSEPGRGTRVSFNFLAEAAVPRGRTPAGKQPPLWKKRVLLVTGSRADVRVLITQLRRWGLDVHSCASASEALAKVAGKERFDLVLAATHMSEARWLGFVQRLRDEGVSIPAVLLSRTRGLSSLNEALRARVLSRSSTPSALYDALGDALESAGVPAYTGLHTTPQFDDTLGKSVPLRILVAEDNEINRKVVLRMLSGFGYKADVAVNGSEVIEAVRRQTYDLVLMDIEMPKVDGIEATKLIVATTARERRPRIIAMSANVMREHVVAALAAGADKYIAKPFAPSELRTALEESADRALPVGGSAEHPSPRILSHERLRCHVEADGSGEFLKELARDFASASLEFQNRLMTAVRAAHDSELRAVLHEYAGVCAVLGAEKLAHLLLEVQKIVRAGSLKGAALLLEQCQQAREETLGAFEAAIGR